MRYRHRLTVTRASTTAGTQDPDTGVFTPAGSDTTLYDGPADVQDTGEQRPRNAAGMPQLNAEATAFLEDESALFDIEPHDTAVVTYENGRTADAEVLFARELDGALLLRFH